MLIGRMTCANGRVPPPRGFSAPAARGALVEVPEIDVDELASRREAGAVVIDVREVDEYEDGHVPGARLIPLGDVPDRIAEVPHDEPVLVICRSGARSQRAAEYMISQGIDATNIVGGTLAWMDAGQPVVEGPEPG
jgi:rhodanese-related sulfurtransferase